MAGNKKNAYQNYLKMHNIAYCINLFHKKFGYYCHSGTVLLLYNFFLIVVAGVGVEPTPA